MAPAFASPSTGGLGLRSACDRPVVCSVRNSRPTFTPTKMVAFAPTGSGYGGSGIPYSGFKASVSSDILETAAAVPVFKTLVGLLRETGLDYELAKGGPFTVFAPTDAAFSALLEPHSFKVLGAMLRPENRAELKKVLAHHVVLGSISSGAIAANGSMTLETLAGCPLTLMGYGKKVSAGSAAIVKPDIPCSNGVIHIVGSLLIPTNYIEQPPGPVEQKFFSSTVLDIYKNSPTPRQALGIDPMDSDNGPGALAMFN